MATLKYKTSDGSYVAIPAMQGPVGPTGVGIKSVKQTTTSSASGGSNVWTITLTDGTTSTLTVKNGAQGATGPAGGILGIANSSTAGYLTVTKADNTTANIGGFLPLTGGALTGNVTLKNNSNQIIKAGSSTSWISGRDTAVLRINTYDAYCAGLSMKTTNGSWEIGVYTSDNLWFTYASDTNYNASTNTVAQFRAASTGVLYGAAWNDYAEYRSGSTTEPGRVVQECPDGILRMTTKRLEPACEIISDTFGFAIGETDECKTPIAATGRVLAYTDCDRYSFNLGDAVCSGENGTVSKMTREEIMMYPERIIGTVSEIPEYETWGTGNVAVNGRIWIRIR